MGICNHYRWKANMRYLKIDLKTYLLSSGKAHPREGFSLIELLVVITIISMMMAILAPSLSKAKESARGVHCLNNLRQLTLAWTAYASETDDEICGAYPAVNPFKVLFPPPPYIPLYDRPWVNDGLCDDPFNELANTRQGLESGVLWAYLNSVEVYKCMSDRTKLLRSYSISGLMNGGISNHNYTKLAQIKKPHRKIVFADDQLGGLDPSLVEAFGSWLSSPYRVGPYFMGDGPSNRHDIASNFSFADGHCEKWAWEDPLFIKSCTEILTEEEINKINKESNDFAKIKEAMSK